MPVISAIFLSNRFVSFLIYISYLKFDSYCLLFFLLIAALPTIFQKSFLALLLFDIWINLPFPTNYFMSTKLNLGLPLRLQGCIIAVDWTLSWSIHKSMHFRAHGIVRNETQEQPWQYLTQENQWKSITSTLTFPTFLSHGTVYHIRLKLSTKENNLDGVWYRRIDENQ